MVTEDLDYLLQTPPGDTHDPDIYVQRMAWWDSDALKSWFSARGYTMYAWVYNEDGPTGVMYPPDVGPAEVLFPFAYQGGKDFAGWNKAPPLSARSSGKRKVIYARDTKGQHVFIKVTENCSEEYRIFRHLHEQGVPTSEEGFQNVIPILDLLPYGDYWFAVMPRWGDHPERPLFQSMREIFKFIHCLLKGLNFLHKHNIVHGDIKTGNILVNHFGRQNSDFLNGLRETLRSQDCLTYAFFDFDCSTMFPPSFTFDQCRLPYQRSWKTLPLQAPSDTSHGEPDFEPFAFDVGMLGVMFCHEFQHLTTHAPMLAPLFDTMITRSISKRFTAANALRFFEEQVFPQTTEKQFAAIPFECDDQTFQPFDMYNRWKGLDQSFVEKWAAFREPPIPLRARILRLVCSKAWAYRVVAYIRRFFPFVNRCLMFG